MNLNATCYTIFTKNMSTYCRRFINHIIHTDWTFESLFKNETKNVKFFKKYGKKDIERKKIIKTSLFLGALFFCVWGGGFVRIITSSSSNLCRFLTGVVSFYLNNFIIYLTGN